MLLYQARTAAVTGDRKPSALERSGGSPSHRWDGREHGPALPLRASPGTRPWWPGTTRCPGNSRKRR